MKKTILVFTCALMGKIYAQETPKVIVEDTIIKTSTISGLSKTWNFSNVIFSNYASNNDSDLVRLKNPIPLYATNTFVNIGDSIVGNLPIKQFSQSGVTLNRTGKYTVVYEGNGTVKIPGQTFSNSEKLKITERYQYQFSTDSIPVSTYNNIYYSFFNKTNHNHIVTVYKKTRTFKGGIGNKIVGINYNAMNGVGNNTNSSIQFSLSPNPASNNTLLTYNLQNASQVKIEIANQSNSVNSIIFNGNCSAGTQQKNIPLNSYSSGLYTISLTIGTSVYSQSLIIQ